MLQDRKLLFVVEPFNWSIKWDGKYITDNVKRMFGLSAKIINPTRRISRIKNQILHFGSRGTYLPNNYIYPNSSNSLIMTWFHGTEKDKEYIRSLPIASKKLDVIHTSCLISKESLIGWGVEEEKIVVVPLGVDTSIFKKSSSLQKKYMRKKLNIPENYICIGSFQKDGSGWGEGNTPKYEKAPDIFCDTVKILKEKYPIFVLLTGPARGYVKNRLAEMNVPFKHFYLKNYLNICKFYNALDLYIISSRAEGGPKAILECFATGIPVVSTDVGMVHDIGKHDYNILISDIDNSEDLACSCSRIIDDTTLRDRLVSNALREIKKFDWKAIAARYYESIYSKFI